MTTLYVSVGSEGPWACDDDNVVCDGYLTWNGALGTAAPNVDGTGRDSRSHRSGHELPPGMVRVGDSPGRVHSGVQGTARGSDFR